MYCCFGYYCCYKTMLKRRLEKENLINYIYSVKNEKVKKERKRFSIVTNLGRIIDVSIFIDDILDASIDQDNDASID